MPVSSTPTSFDRLLATASTYWRNNLPAATGADWVIAEATHHDFRVVLRTLTLANALRRVAPARLLVLTSTDAGSDPGGVRRLAGAFAATEVIDVRRCAMDPAGLCRELSPLALVTSRVDDDQWGPAVEAAMRARVPVIHVRRAASLQAYAHFPENGTGEPTFRAELTNQIGAYFERHLWPRRDLLASSAELVAWRTRGGPGRPGWWRGGGGTACELRTAAERRQFRRYTMERYGFAPDRPVVTVFHDAASAAPGTNRECFGDPAEWLAETARHAGSMPEVNWLFLDHPAPVRCDSAEHFASHAARHAGNPALRFLGAVELSRNALWSVTDLGVTVRGDVGYELPAFGIPVIQAGWSEWSSCGPATVVLDRDAYRKTLCASAEALVRGEVIISPEQVERARLWLWLSRSAAQVPSPLVPAWDLRPGDGLFDVIEVNMSAVESDGDPVFAAVERMWTGREPFLTRFDLTDPHALARLVTRTREVSR
jgi:hypothetical protein